MAAILWMTLSNVKISIKNSLKFVPKGPFNNNLALVQITARRRPGDKPLSEPMMVRSPTHISVTQPQWVKNWANCSYDSSFLPFVEIWVSGLVLSIPPCFTRIFSLAVSSPNNVYKLISYNNQLLVVYQYCTDIAAIQNGRISKQICLNEIICGISLMCQNTTLRVYGAWNKIYYVLCSKHLLQCVMIHH